MPRLNRIVDVSELDTGCVLGGVRLEKVGDFVDIFSLLIEFECERDIDPIGRRVFFQSSPPLYMSVFHTSQMRSILP